MALRSSSAKGRRSSVNLTTMEALSLESDPLTIFNPEDLLVVIPNVRGAWSVALGGSALGVKLNTSSGTGTSTFSLAGANKVDQHISTAAKDLLPSCIFFFISDPSHQTNVVVDGVIVILHRWPLVPHESASNYSKNRGNQCQKCEEPEKKKERKKEEAMREIQYLRLRIRSTRVADEIHDGGG